MCIRDSYTTMQKLAAENTNLSGLQAYRRFVEKAVEVLASREASGASGELIDREIKYIIDNYKDSTLLSDLMHHYIYEYVSAHGVGEKKELVDYYKQYVKDEKLVQDFDQLCACLLYTSRCV